MDKLDFVMTGDGSMTLYHPVVGEHYHSKHGAHQESLHVFVKSGFDFFVQKSDGRQDNPTVNILEVGFGTGLNFLLTADYALAADIPLLYHGVEAYPLTIDMIGGTAYHDYVREGIFQKFVETYADALLEVQEVEKRVAYQVFETKVLSYESDCTYDVIYFDAFAAIHQPEMWTDEVLAHVTKYLNSGGVFVTYAITGNLKRSMKALGFSIEKAPGAPGKREMLRAIKL